MTTWEDVIDDTSQIVADCQDCDWHREGHGTEAVRTVVQDARQHMQQCGHYVKAALD